MNSDMGVSVPDQALAVPAEPCGLGPSGFDPSRKYVHSIADFPITAISHLVESANRLPAAPRSYRGVIDPVCYEDFGVDLLACSGRVRAHSDKDFPRWAHVLIVRCGESAQLKVAHDEPVKLQPGRAIVFDCHRRHSVSQAPTDVLVWAPVHDAVEPVGAETLLARTLARWPFAVPTGCTQERSA
jgi:hypothetical protein